MRESAGILVSGEYRMINVTGKWHSLCVILIFFSLFPIDDCFAESEGYTARMTDTDGNEYLFENFSRNGYEHFNCMVQDTVFKLDFNRIRSITFDDTSEIKAEGYRRATVVLTTNHSSTLYIATDTAEVGGIESNLAISLKLPLEQVTSIIFITERT
jgi:hypothetical protein